ncbi:dihydrolipoyl dehydrogenase [Methanocella sp. MCL-LM]|uniref:dihydrolipoyl dehydrogenase n=1 Tax=Methanocella sp. MCL-LM TaxID=3412035 RepID=UPI003C7303AB
METFDLIVIGSGAGDLVVNYAIDDGYKVALADQGPTGGTCLNTGCIPSKMLIYPADVIRATQEAGSIGLTATIKPDFAHIMERMRTFVDRERRGMEEGLRRTKNLTFIQEVAEFTGPGTLRAGNRELTAPKIVIATGARALIPPIPGLKEAGYLDNVSLLQLRELPKSLIIIGGGYIGCEFGHFFSAMGTEVTIINRPPVLLNDEDPEVSETVTRVLSKYVQVQAGYEAEMVSKEGGKKVVHAKSKKDGTTTSFSADELLVALGRRSNADLLKPEKAGIEVDRKGWIKVNQYLETNVPGVWAIGDVLGKYMFRHTANYHAEVVYNNLFKDDKVEVDEHAVPHAVFTHPQVGHVGMTEADAKAAGIKVLVGRAKYYQTAKGIAMHNHDGFVKLVVASDTKKILGCSVVGPDAAVLVQQVAYMMNCGNQDLGPLYTTQVIHPAISEVVMRAFGNLEPA